VSILDDARPGMDPSIRPQDDLFGHVNGRWLDEEDIPADRSSWGPFVQLADQAEQHVHAIIEELAAKGGDDPDSTKIADLYHSFMDEESVEAKGSKPIRPVLEAAADLRDVRDLAAFLGDFEKNGGTGSSAPTSTDDRNSDRYLLLVRAGSGCPTSPTTATTSSPRSARSTSPT
jgi:predicted metalloendopeptidase